MRITYFTGCLRWVGGKIFSLPCRDRGFGFDMCGERKEPTMSDEKVIRDLVAGQVAAMKAGDARALAARFAADAVTFTLAPPLVNRGAAVVEPDGLVAWFATFDGPVDYEVTDLVVEVGGDLAFCRSVNRLSATPVGRSEGFDLWFRSTVCWRKVAGEWLVVHEHTSTPFYMDGSLRAAVDLRPEVR